MNRKAAMNTTLTALGLATAAGLTTMAFPEGAEGSDSAYDNLPASKTLTGVVRDFQERSEDGGHPDFEKKPDAGFGHYFGIVADQLDSDGKPVFNSAGFKKSGDWLDESGRKMMPPREYIASRAGDSAGSMSNASGGAVTSGDSVAQWFRDVPGVNMSAPLSLTLQRESGTNIYVFDDKEDPAYSEMGGFFPINGALYGNSDGESKNYHFTFELATEFIYDEGAGQVFTFTGDDDVWVFIDGKLVIDLGGVHSAVSQTIELDRLEWLQDGGTYSLHFFFAERHRTQSNFRIETTLNLRNAELPTVSAMYD